MTRFVPNSTMIPNAFFDELMNDLSDKALRLYLVIARKTTGWGKESDCISIAQFMQMSGIKDERTVRAAAKELIDFELIKSIQIPGYPTRFSLIGNTLPPTSDVPPTYDAPPTSDVPNPLHGMQGDPLHGMHPTKTTNKTTNTKTTKYVDDDSSGEAVVVELRSKRQAIPYQQIVDSYHELLPALAQVYKLTETRKTKIKSLWIDELDSIDQWRNYFKFINRSDFLMGRLVARDGRAFVADFDFIINSTNFVKIAEEKYHGKKVS